MGAPELHEDLRTPDEVEDGPRGALVVAPDSVVVRRNAPLLAVLAVLAAAVAVAYLLRALDGGSAADWLLAGALGLIALWQGLAAWDARLPLLVADTQGVRMRLGKVWRGLTWGAIDRIEHESAPSVLRDGRLVVVARNEERALDGLGRGSERHAAWTRRWYGAPLAVPLGLATRSTHEDADLVEALDALAATRAPVLTIVSGDVHEPELREESQGAEDEPESRAADHDDAGFEEAPEATPARTRLRHPGPVLAGLIGRIAGRSGAEPDLAPPAEEAATVETPAPVAPLREPTLARRAEVTVALETDEPVDEDVRAAGEMRRPGSVPLVEDREGWGARVRALVEPPPSVEPLVVEDADPEPAPDPVIGPELAAARTRLGLSVEDLAARTRIRVHVVEAIEVDDFEPCGGDFYARGHLRTLARVLGVDAAPLLMAYDERYAHAPITPGRVFESELAAGGSIRSTRGGPNWSVLVAAVMAIVLVWSIARLLMDSPVELPSTPVLNGSAGPGNAGGATGPAVPVLLRAAGGGAHVVVKDGSGKEIFTGDIAYGQTKAIEVSPPVRVQTSDGSVEVVVDGSEKGAVGETGQAATATYVVR